MAYRAKQRWSQIMKGGNQRVANTFHINPLIASIILNRGVSEDDEIRRYLHGTLEDLEDPLKLDQIEDAASLLYRKISDYSSIRVIGDYDADGICSSYILISTLKKAGAVVSYDIPDRITDGFGMSVRMVEKAFSDGVDTIITCDNGIAQTAEVKRAKELGMTVIITDHHEPNYTVHENGERVYDLPDADVIVDPKKPGDSYPNKDLCGAGVVWKLMYVFERRYLFRNPIYRPSADEDMIPVRECPLTMQNLPFAAIATVTDIMKLLGENRILVKCGLEMLPDTDNIGMQALIKANNLRGVKLSSYHIGFVLGPCLNATGRLDTAKRAVHLLLEKDPGKALSEAVLLTDLNRKRQDMTEMGKALALDMIDHSDLIHDRVLILYLKGIHESVAGIIASKVKDTYQRPVMVFTDTENPEYLKGSGRSIEEYNMHAELTRVSDVFVKFGGHPMAAGATICRDRLEELRTRLNENCTLTQDDLAQKVLIDAAPRFSMLTEDLARELSLIEPAGPGNRSAMFGCSRVKLLKMDLIGRKKNCVKLILQDNIKMEAVYFTDAEGFIAYLMEKYPSHEVENLMQGRENSIRLTIAYRFKINEYNGVRTPQIQIAHFQ